MFTLKKIFILKNKKNIFIIIKLIIIKLNNIELSKQVYNSRQCLLQSDMKRE